MSKVDLIDDAWTDLVFEGKNQAYGAYQLRRNTGRRNIYAMVAVVLVTIFAYIALQIKAGIDERARQAAATQVTELSALNQPKKKAEVKQEEKVIVEPEKVVEKVKSSVKFTAPVIKKDNEVKEEDEIKTQDELMSTKTAIGAFDVKGNDEEGGEILKAKEVIAAPEPPKHEEENKVFDIVEQDPQFPGGNAELMKWIKDNLNYPVVAQENGVQGRVTVGFVVEKDGSITDVRIDRGVDPSLDKEALRVVSKMPRWIPGQQNGQKVRVRYRVPITFRLQ